MEGGARPSSVFPRNQDQVLKRAELHFVTEQTARHERSWEGKVDSE